MADGDGALTGHEAEFLLYRTEDGQARVEVRFAGRALARCGGSGVTHRRLPR